MKSKDIKDTGHLDIECHKCKKFLEKCNGRIIGKVIPCLCFEEKSK